MTRERATFQSHPHLIFGHWNLLNKYIPLTPVIHRAYSSLPNGNDSDNYTRPCLETQILPEGLGYPELPQRIWWKFLLRQQIPSSHSVNRPSIYAVFVLQNFILQSVLTQHQLHHHFIAVKDFWDESGQDKSPVAVSTRYISGPKGFQRQG